MLAPRRSAEYKTLVLPFRSVMALAIATSLALAPVARGQDVEAGGTVHVRATPDTATLTIDREERALPFDGPLSAGLHYFVVTAPGYYRELRDVVVDPGATLDERFELTLDPSLQPRGADTPMIVGGSVLGVLGIAGIVLAIVGATGDRQCIARCDEAGARHVVERPAIDSIVAWSVAGGISLVVGVILAVVGATTERGPRRVALDAGDLTVRF